MRERETDSPLTFISRYIFLPILLLIVTHYILFFVLHLDIAPVFVTLIFAAVVFPFGYDLSIRTGNHVAGAFALGLIVGVTAATGMSTVVLVLLDQGFFPDKRQIQDFIEVSMAIMLAYAAGNATGDFILQLLPDDADSRTVIGSIRAVIALAHGRSLTERAVSLEATIKALTAVVLALGALVVAVRKLISPV